MPTRDINLFTLIIYLMYSSMFSNSVFGQNDQSYAVRLGWQASDRVVIFHVDDAGMSYESNRGTIKALQFGIATSCSVMMPCPWVSEMTKYLRENPQIDAGIHLTHTSEWKTYRWHALSGVVLSPGLADDEGSLWNNVADVVIHARPNEIEREIRTQLSVARKSGFNPTHMDTHMGTMWASPEYLNLYQQIAIEEHIPILIPAGHNTLLQQQLGAGPLSALKQLDGSGDPQKRLRQIGDTLWNGGLAVVDDVYILSYDWQLPQNILHTDENIRNFKTEKYKKLLREIKPGITVILIHCADTDENFNRISDSGITRRGDLLSMTDLALKEFIHDEHIVLTTWRELQQRREKLK
jgi:predicted glycoside hydrolase/deacetylase ChbG (UPF0249 family)